ncbi:MAG: hypothetical protein IJ678_02520 [Kiritimatiellae bacterium]|nr:hypothetical protein [Kiritimatiellia bacterium]
MPGRPVRFTRESPSREQRKSYRERFAESTRLSPEIRARFYPSIERSHDTDKDGHVICFGEIVSVYLLGFRV